MLTVMQNAPDITDTDRALAAYETVFFIIRHDDGWQVERNRRPIGFFPTQCRAIRWAALAAQTVELGGRRATFRVLDGPALPEQPVAPLFAAVA